MNAASRDQYDDLTLEVAWAIARNRRKKTTLAPRWAIARSSQRML